MAEVLSFDLEPVILAVEISGQKYTLREITGVGHIRYFNSLDARTVRDGDQARIANVAELEPLLVSLCLYDSQGNLVPEATIRGWPARIQRELYLRVKEISHMDETSNLESLKERRVEIDRQIARLEEGQTTKNS